MTTDPVADLEIGARRPWRPPRAADGRTGRRAGVMIGTVVIGAALATTLTGGSTGLVNAAGWPLLRRFLAAALQPELDPSFLAVTARASIVTLGYAVLGTVGSVAIGLVGAVGLSERWWHRQQVGAPRVGRRRRNLRWGWYAHRTVWAVPRGIHEAVWGLVLLSVLGRDPLVAVLAIAIPFGAITAKVYAELLDDRHGHAYEALRAAGAGRVAALAYGVVPDAARDMVAYAFYRFECSIRSSVVLGIVGAGGLGLQLSLSFSSLRYGQMWTLIYVLVALSAVGEAWSAMLRGHPGAARVRASLVAVLVMTVGFFVALGVDVRTLWSAHTRRLAGAFARRLWPPHLPAGGLGRLAVEAVRTVQMSIVASVLATVLAVVVAFVAARSDRGRWRSLAGWTARGLLLVCRAVPPPVWALIVLFMLYPGGLPGAVALGLYTFGILGRLLAEVVEHHDRHPADGLRDLGATPTTEFVYAVVPEVAPRFAAYSLYRWEVTMRETVVVGLVGAGGLGRLLAQQNAAFDHAGMLVTVVTLIVLTVGVDLVSARVRRALR